MTDVWSRRAELYVDSDAHRAGDDLEQLVAWAAGACTALVLLVDTEHMGGTSERAESLRDPSHVRNYSEPEFLELVAGSGLGIDDVRRFEHTIDFAAWLARTGCEGDTAEQVRELWGDRVADGRLTLDKIAIRAVKRG